MNTSKVTLLILVTFFITNVSLGQAAKYEFNGTGNWGDVTQWKDGLFPGFTIDDGSVDINGDIIIPEGVTVSLTNGHEIRTGKSPAVQITVNGTLIIDEESKMFPNKLVINGTIDTNGSLMFFEGNGLVINGTLNVFGRVSIDFTFGEFIIGSEGRLNIFNFFSTFRAPTAIVDGTIMIESGGGAVFDRSSVVNNNLIINNGGLSVNFAFDGITNNNTIINNGSFSIIDNSFTNNGILENSSDGSIDIEFGQGLINGNESEFINEGEIEVFFSNITMNNISSNLGSIIIVESSIMTINNDFSNNGFIGINEENSTLNINSGIFTNRNTIINNYQIINESENFINEGTLSGINISHTGILDNTTGVISPGTERIPIGIYTLENGLVQNIASSILVQISSETAVDQIISDSEIVLTGNLNIELIDGINDIALDTEYTIIAGSTIVGTFDSVTIPALLDDKTFEVIYTNNEVKLKVVQENILSITDFEITTSNNELVLFPNPAKDFIELKGLENNTKISVYNLLGQEIIHKETLLNKKLNISELKGNNYILKVGEKFLHFIKE